MSNPRIMLAFVKDDSRFMLSMRRCFHLAVWMQIIVCSFIPTFWDVPKKNKDNSKIHEGWCGMVRGYELNNASTLNPSSRQLLCLANAFWFDRLNIFSRHFN